MSGRSSSEIRADIAIMDASERYSERYHDAMVRVLHDVEPLLDVSDRVANLAGEWLLHEPGSVQHSYGSRLADVIEWGQATTSTPPRTLPRERCSICLRPMPHTYAERQACGTASTPPGPPAPPDPTNHRPVA